MKSFVIAGCACALLSLAFLPLLFAVIGMTLGVAVIAKGRIDHGFAVILFAATCGYYSISSGVSLVGTYWGDVHIPTWLELAPQQVRAASVPDWHVVSLETRTKKIDAASSVCRWKLVVSNDSSQAAVFRGSIEFQDAQGVRLATDRLDVDRSGPVPAGSQRVFTGSLAINSKKKVARAVPQIIKAK